MSFPSRTLLSPHALRRAVLAATVVATGLGLGACAADPASSTATSPPSSAPSAATTPAVTATASPAALQWTGTVCRALGPVVGTLTSPPNTDINNLSATRQNYISYLDTAARQADTARREISAAGAPPVVGGEQIGSTVNDQVTQLRTNVGQALTQIQQTDPNDATSVTQALKAAGNVGGSLVDSTQVMSTLRRNPQLAQAIDQEPSCASLRSTGAGS